MFDKNELTTMNPDRAMDYHLRALGIKDRRYWKIVSADDKNYSDGTLVARPDWLLENTETRKLVNLEYKNRIPGQSGPTQYERYQAILTQYAIEGEYMFNRNEDREVESWVLFGNSEKFLIEHGDHDFDFICEAIQNVGIHLHRLGVMRHPNDLYPASQVARYLVDPHFNDPAFGHVDAMRAGEKAHRDMKEKGLTLH
jgi:hypothetical protein